MKLDWRAVRPEHATKACELVADALTGKKIKEKGLFVIFGGNRLPAKNVARAAYQLAHNLPSDTTVAFASGDGTLRRLQELGLQVQRL
jgi:hypothetical protein